MRQYINLLDSWKGKFIIPEACLDDYCQVLELLPPSALQANDEPASEPSNTGESSIDRDPSSGRLNNRFDPDLHGAMVLKYISFNDFVSLLCQTMASELWLLETQESSDEEKNSIYEKSSFTRISEIGIDSAQLKRRLTSFLAADFLSNDIKIDG